MALRGFEAGGPGRDMNLPTKCSRVRFCASSRGPQQNTTEIAFLCVSTRTAHEIHQRSSMQIFNRTAAKYTRDRLFRARPTISQSKSKRDRLVPICSQRATRIVPFQGRFKFVLVFESKCTARPNALHQFTVEHFPQTAHNSPSQEPSHRTAIYPITRLSRYSTFP
jgi:hypothetical protein